MERLYTGNTQELDATSITPDKVRDLSLGELTELHGTLGLYIRLMDTLERTDLDENELIQLSLYLGFALHANEERTNGPYIDHLMRVTLHLLETFKIKDPSLVAAAPLHDSLENHPRDLVLALTGDKPPSGSIARPLGQAALAKLTNDEIVKIVSTVTNPIVQPGEDKLAVYTQHTWNLVLNSPKGRVLKLADFIDNAGGNHATIGPKQRKLDEKYIGQYRTHMLGLFLPDSLLVGEERERALHLLSKGHARALGRLAAQS